MKEIGTRIRDALEARNGGNQSEMARHVGVSPQAVQKWIAGESVPRGRNLRLASEFLGVSEPYILFGSDAEAPGMRQVVALGDDEELLGTVRIKRVKLRLSAGIVGFAADPVDEEDNPIVFRRTWFESRGYIPEKLVAIKVKGESMEPGLSDGDTVVINTADTKPKNGEVFAVNFEGEAVVKRMARDIGFWWLTSDNPNQARYPRQRCEGESCIIIGRVVLVQREHI